MTVTGLVAEGEDILHTLFAPEHAGELGALGDDGLAVGLDDAGVDEQALTSIEVVVHVRAVVFEVGKVAIYITRTPNPSRVPSFRQFGHAPMLRAGPWLVRFLAEANGTVTGDATQSVWDGQDATQVAAVPEPGFVFRKWSDDSTENPRRLTAVRADTELKASFAPAGLAASSVGTFLAAVGKTEVRQGRGPWDLTGTFPSGIVAGYPLTLDLGQDGRGRLTGNAALEVTTAEGKVTSTVNLPVRGRLMGTGGALVLRLVMRGADSAGTVRAGLLKSFDLPDLMHLLGDRLTVSEPWGPDLKPLGPTGTP